MSAPGDGFHEDFTRVRGLERLRAQLAGLVERQLRAEAEAHLLEQRYVQQFGALELRGLQAQLRIEAARVRRVLMAGRCAAGHTPDLVEAAAIEHEVARLGRRTQRRCTALRAALDTPPPVVAVPPSDAALSAALRRVLRCLHPDVCGEAGEAYDWHWPRVVADFRAGRTAALQALADRLELAMLPVSACAGPEFEHEELRLRRAVESYRQRLQRMHARRPLQLRECLDDPAWLAREHAALTRRVLHEEGQAAAEGARLPVDAGAAAIRRAGAGAGAQPARREGPRAGAVAAAVPRATRPRARRHAAGSAPQGHPAC